MKATEIIRGVLDLIDDVETLDSGSETVFSEKESTDPNNSILPLSKDAEEINRYKQIVDLLPKESDPLTPFSNTPIPKVADIAVITTQSGDDLHKSKHPSDIRSNATSMYPFLQYNPDKE